MPLVTRVDPSVLDPRDATLAENPFYNLLARRPEIMQAWAKLDDVFLGSTSLVANSTKEAARRTLAEGAGCAYCASLGSPRRDSVDTREVLASALAQMLVSDHRNIDEHTFAALREEFSEAQIVELVAWLCMKLGANMLGAVMQLDPATDAQIDAYARLVSST